MRPMLAKPVSANVMIELATNDDWVFQPKVDGRRKLVQVEDGRVTAWGRDGQSTDLPMAIVLRLGLALSSGRFILDGELVEMPQGPRLVLFDLPEVEELVKASAPFEMRLFALKELARLAQWSPDLIQVLDVAETPENKLNLFKRVSDMHGEGLILRRGLARYQYGVRSKDLCKYKLVRTVDAVVVRLGDEGKQNLALAVYDENGTEHELGTVSALTGDGPLVKVGDVVMVEYLGSYDGTKLIQPVRPLIRRDKAPEECLLDQLELLDRTAILEE